MYIKVLMADMVQINIPLTKDDYNKEVSTTKVSNC